MDKRGRGACYPGETAAGQRHKAVKSLSDLGGGRKAVDGVADNIADPFVQLIHNRPGKPKLRVALRLQQEDELIGQNNTSSPITCNIGVRQKDHKTHVLQQP